MTTSELGDVFLSEEDLDLQSLTDEELEAVRTAWLCQAQSTNDEDRFTYSRGVFTREPAGDENSSQNVKAGTSEGKDIGR